MNRIGRRSQKLSENGQRTTSKHQIRLCLLKIEVNILRLQRHHQRQEAQNVGLFKTHRPQSVRPQQVVSPICHKRCHSLWTSNPPPPHLHRGIRLRGINKEARIRLDQTGLCRRQNQERHRESCQHGSSIIENVQRKNERQQNTAGTDI